MRIWKKLLRYSLSSILILSTDPVIAQRTMSLILVELGQEPTGVNNSQTVVRYRFRDGVLIGRQPIITTDGLRPRFDLGGNKILRNRYLVTDWGDVVDLSNGKILALGKGEVLGFRKENGMPVLNVDREGEKSGIFDLDVLTGKTVPTQHPSLWKYKNPNSSGADQRINPGQTLNAVGEGLSIWLIHADGSKSWLGNFLRSGGFECNSNMRPTFLWVDDGHLISQQGEGNIVLVDIRGKVEPLVQIDGVDPGPACGVELRRDEGGSIFYEDAWQTWKIDVVGRKAEPYDWYSTGNRFEIEYRQSNVYGRVIRHNGTEIGRWWCDEEGVTAPGYIALRYGKVGSNLGYPDGVKVWSEESGQWTTIQPGWVGPIIGWIEDKEP